MTLQIIVNAAKDVRLKGLRLIYARLTNKTWRNINLLSTKTMANFTIYVNPYMLDSYTSHFLSFRCCFTIFLTLSGFQFCL